jgi:RND family efflux transporter MFP subunit
MKKVYIASLYFGCLVAVVGCGGSRPKIAPPEPPLVTVANPILRDLDSLGEFTGRLASIESQRVQAQVTGYLKEIKFKDGAIVQPGEVLYEIESEPYQATLANAKAMVAKSLSDESTLRSQLALATSQLERAQSLKKTNAISQQEFDEASTKKDNAATSVESAVATLNANRAAERKAEFDLKNCSIRSDLTVPGRVSRTELTRGNLVVAGQTFLCTVTSLDPIHAYWDVDESTSLNYRRRIFDEKSLPDPRGAEKLACWVGMKDEVRGADGKWPHAGFVDYIAPEMVRGSGTREIRAVLENPNYRLTPGDSIRVQVVSGRSEKLLTVPEIAIGSQQQQKFVYVIVSKDGKSFAEFRPVQLGPVREIEAQRLQVVLKGLSPEESVVVNGLLRVRPGAEVRTSPSPQ